MYFDSGRPAPRYGPVGTVLVSTRRPSTCTALTSYTPQFTLNRPSVVDTGPAIVADRTTLGVNTTDFMTGDAGRNGLIPLIAFHGKPSGPPTRFDGTPPASPPGEVSLQFARPDDGVFGGQVRLERPGVVMLKATYNPAWQARVDGRTVPTQMLAPSCVGVPVPAGAHTVEFRYRESPLSWPLLAFGAVVLIALAVVPRLLDRRRARRSDVWPRTEA